MVSITTPSINVLEATDSSMVTHALCIIAGTFLSAACGRATLLSFNECDIYHCAYDRMNGNHCSVCNKPVISSTCLIYGHMASITIVHRLVLHPNFYGAPHISCCNTHRIPSHALQYYCLTVLLYYYHIILHIASVERWLFESSSRSASELGFCDTRVDLTIQ